MPKISSTESDRLKIMSNAELKMSAATALDELMESKPIDDISVNSICDKAGMSRATFYRYFSDKYAICTWFLRYLQLQGVDRIGRSCSWYEGYFLTEALILEHIHFFKHSAASNDSHSIDRATPKIRRNTLFVTLEEYHHVTIDDHMRFLVNAAVLVETHLFPSWHYGKYDCSLEEVCRWAAECVPHELFELLNTPIKPNASSVTRKL
jgi:AcrR family transcriptional regulator